VGKETVKKSISNLELEIDPVKINSLDEIFQDGGVLSKARSGYKLRPGQLSMAKAVENAINKDQTLMAEGPTGVGKSFAYLIPAMLKMANKTAVDAKRVVVATANIALQDQLVGKDVPYLVATLPGCQDLRYMVVKGRNNYLCLLKIQEIEKKREEHEEHTDIASPFAEAGDLLLEPKAKGDDDTSEDIFDPEISELIEWSTRSFTGDRNELTKIYRMWNLVSTSSEECMGSKCPYKSGCFVNRARRKMMVVPIIVSNYHFLLTKPAIAQDAILICDEAHDLADIARSVLGWDISRSSFSRTLSFVKKLDKGVSERLKQLINDMWITIEHKLEDGKHPHLRIRSWSDDVGFSLDPIIALLNKFITDYDKEGESDIKMIRGLKMVGNALAKFDELKAIGPEDGRVYWFEKSGKWINIHAAFVDVSEALQKVLYENARSVIMTSATMTSGGSFQFIREDVGLAADGEIRAPSPFDLKRQGMIIVPRDMPDIPKWNEQAKVKEWHQKAGEYAVQLMQICGGRCLMLFTSWKSLDAVYPMVRKAAISSGINVMEQREAPKMKLIERFKEDETSVLLGVASFWQGIDVPGKALSGLFIDKIPFMVPNTPFNEALSELIEERGGNPFMDLSVPRATIALCQGVGRLIRTTTDRGIVVITDTRLINKRYGEMIIRSLPEFKKVQDMDKAVGFLDSL